MTVHAEPVTVRHQGRIVRGFSACARRRAAIADSDLIQLARSAVTRLVFHFKDGSLHDETAVFSQQGQFKLVTDHLVQKGPSFPKPMDMSINVATGI